MHAVSLYVRITGFIIGHDIWLKTKQDKTWVEGVVGLGNLQGAMMPIHRYCGGIWLHWTKMEVACLPEDNRQHSMQMRQHSRVYYPCLLMEELFQFIWKPLHMFSATYFVTARAVRLGRPQRILFGRPQGILFLREGEVPGQVGRWAIQLHVVKDLAGAALDAWEHGWASRCAPRWRQSISRRAPRRLTLRIFITARVVVCKMKWHYINTNWSSYYLLCSSPFFLSLIFPQIV